MKEAVVNVFSLLHVLWWGRCELLPGRMLQVYESLVHRSGGRVWAPVRSTFEYPQMSTSL